MATGKVITSSGATGIRRFDVMPPAFVDRITTVLGTTPVQSALFARAAMYREE